MKKAISKNRNTEDIDMLPEYDFSGGVRGKHYKAYRKGHTVKIHKSDGTVSIQYFQPGEGSVLLEPEVRKYFPDADAVNNALRCLIPLIQNNRAPKQRKRLALK